MSENAIIIDNGSGSIKAGWSGQELPEVIFPAMVNKNYPIQHGIITSWEDIEQLWFNTFYHHLNIAENTAYNTFLTESAFNSKTNQEKMSEIMFERFNVPSLYLGSQPILSLFATGRTNGTVIDCGDGFTQIVPINDGKILYHAISKTDIAGKEINNYLTQKLAENGYIIDNKKIITNIKEKLLFFETNGNDEYSNKIYTLPDGNKIKIGSEQYQCCEILFKPYLIEQQNEFGLTELIHESIMKCNIEDRRDLYSNIIMVGGSSMIKGFNERLRHELTKIVPKTVHVKVESPLNRQYLPFIGASILAELPEFEDSWFTKDEFNDCGPIIVHRKCSSVHEDISSLLQ